MHIILLRGINVGGHNKLPMAEFKTVLEGLGARDVKTYIQSGNAVLRGNIDGQAIGAAIEDAKGFRPSVMVLSRARFVAIADANPFPNAEGKTVHIWFLAEPPHFDTKRADELATSTERYRVTDTAIYLHAPDGIGRSKLAAKIEALAQVPATARNWNTMIKLLTLSKQG